MSDYLGRLAARALGVGEVARPRRPLFEPRFGLVEPAALEPSAAQVARPSVEDAVEAPAARKARSQMAAPEPAVAQAARSEAATQESSSAEAERSVQPPAEPAPPPARTVRPPKTRARSKPRPDAPGEPIPAVPRPPLPTQPPLLLHAPAPRLLARIQEAAPAVKVTIGRVEVRAVTPEPAREPKRRRPPAPKRMSLDEYLSQSRGRGR